MLRGSPIHMLKNILTTPLYWWWILLISLGFDQWFQCGLISIFLHIIVSETSTRGWLIKFNSFFYFFCLFLSWTLGLLQNSGILSLALDSALNFRALFIFCVISLRKIPAVKYIIMSSLWWNSGIRLKFLVYFWLIY